MLVGRCSVNIWMGPEPSVALILLAVEGNSVPALLPCFFLSFPFLLCSLESLRICAWRPLWLITLDGQGLGFCQWFFLGSCNFWFSKHLVSALPFRYVCVYVHKYLCISKLVPFLGRYCRASSKTSRTKQTVKKPMLYLRLWIHFIVQLWGLELPVWSCVSVKNTYF